VVQARVRVRVRPLQPTVDGEGLKWEESMGGLGMEWEDSKLTRRVYGRGTAAAGERVPVVRRNGGLGGRGCGVYRCRKDHLVT
jgi:hypothetical protein